MPALLLWSEWWKAERWSDTSALSARAGTLCMHQGAICCFSDDISFSLGPEWVCGSFCMIFFNTSFGFEKTDRIWPLGMGEQKRGYRPRLSIEREEPRSCQESRGEREMYGLCVYKRNSRSLWARYNSHLGVLCRACSSDIRYCGLWCCYIRWRFLLLYFTLMSLWAILLLSGSVWLAAPVMAHSPSIYYRPHNIN